MSLYLFGLGDESELLFWQVLWRSLLIFALILVHFDFIRRREVVTISRSAMRHPARNVRRPRLQTLDAQAPKQLIGYLVRHRTSFCLISSGKTPSFCRYHATECTSIPHPSLLLFGFLNARPIATSIARQCANQPGTAAARHSQAPSVHLPSNTNFTPDCLTQIWPCRLQFT